MRTLPKFSVMFLLAALVGCADTSPKSPSPIPIDTWELLSRDLVALQAATQSAESNSAQSQTASNKGSLPLAMNRLSITDVMGTPVSEEEVKSMIEKAIDGEKKLPLIFGETPIFSAPNQNAAIIGFTSKNIPVNLYTITGEWYGVRPSTEQPWNNGWVTTQALPNPEAVIGNATVFGASSAGELSSITQVRTMADMVTQVRELWEKWSKDPWIKLIGFSINIAVPPSVKLDFEFPKEK